MVDSLEVAKRVKAIASRKGITGAELARRIGTDRSTINRYYKGTRKISINDVGRFAEALGVDVAELMFGDDSPSNLVRSTSKIVKIPILGKIACGDPIYAEENFDGYREEIAEFVPKGEIMFLEAQGDSMEPTIPNGAWVMIRRQPDVENGEIAAVLINGNEEATLKRIVKQDGLVVLMPDNPKHKPLVVNEQNPAYIIGKAVKFSQDL
ncbi:LexA family protein [Domibacillus antri]|uniref:LexA family protein n=1 Tax=Domibacillus antri TaxID=1714264 RepID=UPI000AF7F83D|nr:S24 family peptidase [Domibacillus antri]